MQRLATTFKFPPQREKRDQQARDSLWCTPDPVRKHSRAGIPEQVYSVGLLGAKQEILVNTIHILNAVLCADCDVISDSAGDACVVCGSRSLLSLGRVLGGTIGEERAVRVPTNEKELRHMLTLLVNPGASSKLSPSRSRIGRRLWKVG